MTAEYAFATREALSVAPEEKTRAVLEATGPHPDDLKCTGDSIHFLTKGWYEVLLTVEWDGSVTEGTRFAHTNIPDAHPLHSEAINALVLSKISDGRQLLRGNTVFDPDGISEIFLEVWHDAPRPVVVKRAELKIRPLDQRA